MTASCQRLRSGMCQCALVQDTVLDSQLWQKPVVCGNAHAGAALHVSVLAETCAATACLVNVHVRSMLEHQHQCQCVAAVVHYVKLYQVQGAPAEPSPRWHVDIALQCYASRLHPERGT